MLDFIFGKREEPTPVDIKPETPPLSAQLEAARAVLRKLEGQAAHDSAVADLQQQAEELAHKISEAERSSEHARRVKAEQAERERKQALVDALHPPVREAVQQHLNMLVRVAESQAALRIVAFEADRAGVPVRLPSLPALNFPHPMATASTELALLLKEFGELGYNVPADLVRDEPYWHPQSAWGIADLQTGGGMARVIEKTVSIAHSAGHHDGFYEGTRSGLALARLNDTLDRVRPGRRR